MKQDIEEKIKDCTACLASRKNLENVTLRKNFTENSKKHSALGQEIQFDFTGKLHNKNLHGERQILMAVDRFTEWPNVKNCKQRKPKL